MINMVTTRNEGVWANKIFPIVNYRSYGYHGMDGLVG
jgi:hypothetical protein